jgi:hypothetical protein
MYKCDDCKNSSKPGELYYRLAIEFFDHVHPVRYERREIDGKMHSKVIDNGGEGKQIKKELKLCRFCYDKRTQENVCFNTKKEI